MTALTYSRLELLIEVVPSEGAGSEAKSLEDQLINAAAARQCSKCLELVRKGALPGVSNASGVSALRIACGNGLLRVTTTFLGKCSDEELNGKDLNGMSIVALAASSTNGNVYKLLSAIKTRIGDEAFGELCSVPEVNGQIPLHYLVQRPELDAIRLVLPYSDLSAQGAAKETCEVLADMVSAQEVVVMIKNEHRRRSAAKESMEISSAAGSSGIPATDGKGRL